MNTANRGRDSIFSLQQAPCRPARQAPLPCDTHGVIIVQAGECFGKFGFTKRPDNPAPASLFPILRDLFVFEKLSQSRRPILADQLCMRAAFDQLDIGIDT